MEPKEWVPTGAGVYRLGAGMARVRMWSPPDVTGFSIGSEMLADGSWVAHTVPGPMPQSGWSLLAPSWQDGAPTEAQLEAWPWWAVIVDGALVCGEPEYLAPMDIDPDVVEVNPKSVVRSAPIQPDWSDGPRWVPLSVAGGGG